MIDRNAELDESLLGIVEEVREDVRALYPQEALILQDAVHAGQIAVEYYNLVGQEYELQLRVLVYLAHCIRNALQMERILEDEFTHDLIASRLFHLGHVRTWIL